MENLNLKKTFLYSLIASVAFSALMGIWVILANEFNEFQGRVLGTTLTIILTSILGLACGAFWESPKSNNSALKFIPILGISLAFIGALIALALIWQVIGSSEETILKAFSITGIFAFSFSQLSLLSLANLSNKFKWALTAVYVVVLSLASISSILIILEPQSEDGFVMRLMGILAVIDAALTVMIPIFHRLSRGDFSANQNEIGRIDAEIERLTNELNSLNRQKEKILSEK